MSDDVKRIPVVGSGVSEMGDGWCVASGSLITVDYDGRHWVNAFRRDVPGTHRIELVRDEAGAFVARPPEPFRTEHVPAQAAMVQDYDADTGRPVGEPYEATIAAHTVIKGMIR